MHNQSERALELYEKAIAMRPGYPEPMLNMANLYMSAFKDVRGLPSVLHAPARGPLCLACVTLCIRSTRKA